MRESIKGCGAGLKKWFLNPTRTLKIAYVFKALEGKTYQAVMSSSTIGYKYKAVGCNSSFGFRWFGVKGSLNVQGVGFRGIARALSYVL